MSPERPTTHPESYLKLREAIFASERSAIAEELLPMFDAENTACYHRFLEMLPEDLDDTLDEAKEGDDEAIAKLATTFRTFRENVESDLAENNPDAYEAFIGAVTLGNAPLAEKIVDDHFATLPLGDGEELPDEAQ